jgi:hypothetical protein
MEDSLTGERPDLLSFFAGTPVERVVVQDFDMGTKTGVAVEFQRNGARYRHAVRVPFGQPKAGLQTLKDWVNGR